MISRYDFSAGRLLRDYVEDNDLSDYKWISTWPVQFDDDGNLLDEEIHQTSRAATEVNPYLNTPLLGDYFSGKSFVYHKSPSKEQTENEINFIKNNPPDFIIGLIDKEFLDHAGLNNDYVLVKELKYMQPWKNQYPVKSTFIMAKRELAEMLELGR